MKKTIYYLFRNNLKRIVLDRTNYLLVSLSYLLLAFILRDLMQGYLDSQIDLISGVINPFFNTFNVIICFIYIFGLSNYLSLRYKRENESFLSRLKISELSFQISELGCAITYSCFVIFPGISIFLILRFFGITILTEAIFPFASLLLFHLFLFSWMSLFTKIFNNRNITVLLTFFTIGFFSFLNSYSSIINNLFLSNLIRELSFVLHLENLYAGIVRLSDIAYLISWPVALVFLTTLYFGGKRNKGKGLSNIVGSIGTICVILILNFIVSKNNFTIDYSPNKIMTLSSSSKKELDRIKGHIQIKIFSDSKNIKQINRNVELLKNYYKDIVVESINPDLRPDLVRKYVITKMPSIVFKGSIGKTHVVNKINEENMILGMMKVSKLSQGKFRIVDERGLTLEKHKYLIHKLNKSYYKTSVSSGIEDIGDSESLIYVVKYDLNNGLKEKLDNLLKSGRHVFLFIGPNFNNRYSKWNGFLKFQGVNLNNHFAVDIIDSIDGSKGTVPLVSNPNLFFYNNFTGRIIFPLAAAMSLNHDTLKQSKSQMLVGTSSSNNSSWGESQVNELNTKLTFNSSDIDGPVGLIIDNIFEDNSNGRLTIFSSDSFLDDEYQGISSNVDYFVSLYESRERINITQKVSVNLSSVYKEVNKNNVMSFNIFIFIVPGIYLFLYLFRRFRND
jgi:hypothetical protein